MSTTYAHRQTTAQKVASSKAASLFDSSSQSESLQRKANMANNVVQRLFNNTMPSSFSEEIETANKAATKRLEEHESMDDTSAYYDANDIHGKSPEELTAFDKDKIGPGPFSTFSNRFKAFIISRYNANEAFKWIYNEKNGLVVIDKDLKHSVAAGGAPVKSAGHGICTNINPLTVQINNDTGHYKTSFESLNEAKAPWEKEGIRINLSEFVYRDFAKLFNKINK